ncbi:hypothetical protein E1267_22255 [Nonomuraea longispora]|uniref:Uncharacterized protein n=1 Tax=Nonomuraea longispora TaxID=1848320 RepID=A0A4R4ND78_9ACTN|nr:hypothetical protein E1267_22255 [Nonomuraea longispora]
MADEPLELGEISFSGWHAHTDMMAEVGFLTIARRLPALVVEAPRMAWRASRPRLRPRPRRGHRTRRPRHPHDPQRPLRRPLHPPGRRPPLSQQGVGSAIRCAMSALDAQ